MMLRSLGGRGATVAALGVALSLHAKTGAADPSKDKWEAAVRFCSNVYNDGLELEDQGKLLRAREVLLSGAKARCIAPVRQACRRRYDQLAAEIPSVVPIAMTEEGDPLDDVQVAIDNQIVASRLDGRSLQLDPGLHEFAYSVDGKVVAAEKIMIVQGQRNRPISITIKADKTAKKTLVSPTGMAALDAKLSLDKTATDKPGLDT